VESVAKTSALHRPGRIPIDKNLLKEMANEAKSQNCASMDDQQTDVFPLSLAQEGLWILDRISPGSAAYNMPEAWRFKGELDLNALRASLTEIRNRHEILRTIFSDQQCRPIQIVMPAHPFEFPLIDVADAADSESECSRRIEIEARRPFDLKSGPLFRTHHARQHAPHYFGCLVLWSFHARIHRALLSFS